MASKERQLGFGDYERSFVKKQTRRERFLAEMEKVVPFSELVSMLEPFYPRVGRQGGRPRWEPPPVQTWNAPARMVPAHPWSRCHHMPANCQLDQRKIRR